MGNCRLEYRQSHVNIVPPIVSKTAIVERKQNVGIGVIQSFDASITTREWRRLLHPM